MAWIYLILAGVFEIGWPVDLKLAGDNSMRLIGVSIAIIFMGISGFLLYLAQQTIPIGTAYAIWTGIGAGGTFMVGVIFFGDPTSLTRYLGILLILAGLVMLKIS